MCQFPSWIELEDKSIVYLTDKDTENPIFNDSQKYDIVGHSAIRKMYPNIKGTNKEGFPYPPEIVKNIRDGKMKKLMKLGGIKEMHLNSDGEYHRTDGPAIEHVNGTKFWWINGEKHREDGPTIEYANGTKYWHKNNKLHRVDGPAVEYSDGDKFWYKNGEYHRTDGPACEYANGDKSWYLNNKKFSEQEFNEAVGKVK